MQDGEAAVASLDAVHRRGFRPGWFRIVAWSLFWLVTVWGAARGTMSIVAGTPHMMHDFVAPYSGARCLLLGCDSYNPDQVYRAFLDAGGQSNETAEQWNYTPPVYPPSTLIELLPFAFLNYHAARIAWFVLSTAAFIASFLLWAQFIAPAYRPWMALLGALLRASYGAAFATEAGQTSFIAVGLAAIALWCFIRDRHTLAGSICLGVAMGLKPQLAGIVFLYLILRPVFRRVAVESAIVAVALLAIGGVWVSVSAPSQHWRTELSQQIRRSQQPGAVNDPSTANKFSPDMVNAQAAWALVAPDPSAYNLLSYLLFAALAVPFGIKAWRGAETSAGMFAALGAIACIGLLPVYHRVYDLLILLFAFPSLICFFAQRRKFRWIALGAMLVALIPASVVPRLPGFQALNPVWHFQALAMIVLAVTWVAAMYTREATCAALETCAEPKFNAQRGSPAPQLH
jgi:hypothetical protein